VAEEGVEGSESITMKADLSKSMARRSQWEERMLIGIMRERRSFRVLELGGLVGKVLFSFFFIRRLNFCKDSPPSTYVKN
jgi:hypothetical protein